MHVVQIWFLVDPENRAPEKLLDDWYTLTDIAGAVASAGATVTVVLASNVAGRVDRSAVSYRFVSPEREGALLTKSREFVGLLDQLSPDVFHIHGLCFPREVLELHRLMPEVPIFLQDHAEHVPRIWNRRTWRRGVAAASGVSFCAREQADPFYRAGLIEPHIKVFEIPESTSSCSPGDAAQARALTGLGGDPALLSVGHLNRNKDPLTVLDGVSAAVTELPDLQLWCCYASAPLQQSVEKRIAADAALRERVHLLGRVPHERIEMLMRGADLFVLGSHREGSSFSTIEAMATGLQPVVTHIPSLRALTGDGCVGELWSCGDATDLARALVRAAKKPREATRKLVRDYFDEHLSARALGRKLTTAYRSLIGGESMNDGAASGESE